MPSAPLRRDAEQPAVGGSRPGRFRFFRTTRGGFLGRSRLILLGARRTTRGRRLARGTIALAGVIPASRRRPLRILGDCHPLFLGPRQSLLSAEAAAMPPAIFRVAATAG